MVSNIFSSLQSAAERLGFSNVEKPNTKIQNTARYDLNVALDGTPAAQRATWLKMPANQVVSEDVLNRLVEQGHLAQTNISVTQLVNALLAAAGEKKAVDYKGDIVEVGQYTNSSHNKNNGTQTDSEVNGNNIHSLKRSRDKNNEVPEHASNFTPPGGGSWTDFVGGSKRARGNAKSVDNNSINQNIQKQQQDSWRQQMAAKVQHEKQQQQEKSFVDMIIDEQQRMTQRMAAGITGSRTMGSMGI